MNARTFTFSLLLLACATGVSAQTLPRDTEPPVARPLNLSTRKPVVPLTDATLVAPAPEVQAGAVTEMAAPVLLPYGAGFESRQQGGSTGSGKAGGSGSAGGGGRGGAGRGR